MNRNAIDFTGKMQAARDLAQISRNRGQHTGKSAKGWNHSRPIYCSADSHEWFIMELQRDWRKRKASIINDFKVACLNGPRECDHRGVFYDDIESI